MPALMLPVAVGLKLTPRMQLAPGTMLPPQPGWLRGFSPAGGAPSA